MCRIKGKTNSHRSYRNSSGKCYLLTLFRFPKPILWIAAVFHSGRGGWNWTPDGWLLSTPRGSVINTASPLNVCVVVMDDLLVLWVTISTPDGKWKTSGQFALIIFVPKLALLVCDSMAESFNDSVLCHFRVRVTAATTISRGVFPLGLKFWHVNPSHPCWP